MYVALPSRPFSLISISSIVLQNPSNGGFSFENAEHTARVVAPVGSALGYSTITHLTLIDDSALAPHCLV